MRSIRHLFTALAVAPSLAAIATSAPAVAADPADYQSISCYSQWNDSTYVFASEWARTGLGIRTTAISRRSIPPLHMSRRTPVLVDRHQRDVDLPGADVGDGYGIRPRTGHHRRSHRRTADRVGVVFGVVPAPGRIRSRMSTERRGRPQGGVG